jgi:hypothetical protein
MRIACVGLVGKANEPLALRVYRDGVALDALDTTIENDQDSPLLRFHYLIYCSLDIVDERHKQPGQTGVPTTNKISMYLGYLCPIEEFHLYGYVTNTHIKIVVAVEEQVGTGTAQPELQTFCKQVHGLYTNQLLNSFAELSEPISSPRFQQGLDDLVGSFNAR